MARKDTDVAGTLGQARRRGHPLPRRGQPRPEGLRRPAPLRHRARQRGQASVVLRRQALLPRRRAGARRRRGRAADVLRALPGRPAGRRRQPPRHPGAAGMVIAADHAWRGAQPLYVRSVDFRAALLDQTRDFGELIRSADPSTPVPTCPGWTLKQLFRHVGRGNRWAAQIIADRRTERLDPRDVRDGKPPDDPDAAIDWLNDGAQLIIDAVDRVGPETRVWTFLGAAPVRLVDPPAPARSHGAPRRRGAGAGPGLRPVAGAGRRRDQRVDRADDRSGRAAAAAVAERGGRCICTPPTTGSVRPVSGRSSTTRTASAGRTSTARATLRCAGRPTDLLLAIVRRRTAADGWRRGIRRHRRVGRLAGAHAVLGGVSSRP